MGGLFVYRLGSIHNIFLVGFGLSFRLFVLGRRSFLTQLHSLGYQLARIEPKLYDFINRTQQQHKYHRYFLSFAVVNTGIFAHNNKRQISVTMLRRIIIYNQINSFIMSLLSQSSSSFFQEKRALIDIKEKENINQMSPIYSFAQTSHRKQIVESRDRLGVGQQQHQELLRKAKVLEAQLADYKQMEVKLKKQIESERTLKRVFESELIQVKQYLMRQERLEQTNDVSQRKFVQQLSQSKKQIEQLRSELNSQRGKSKMDSDKYINKKEEMDQLRRELQNQRSKFQQSQKSEKDLQQKLSESEKSIIELKFEKNSLVQQLKIEKIQKQALFRQANKQKCEQFLSVTRQLNQMSVECAKWRTQWEELRSKEESGCVKEKCRFALIQSEQQKIICQLQERLEQKQKLESLSMQEAIRLNEEVMRIQQSEKVRKEEMIKKDRYVLKLEFESKKFEAECQLRIKEIQEQSNAKIRDIEQLKCDVQKQNSLLIDEKLMLKSQIEKLNQAFKDLQNNELKNSLQIQQQASKIAELERLTSELTQQITNKGKIFDEKWLEIQNNSNNLITLKNQNSSLHSQITHLNHSLKQSHTQYHNHILSLKTQLSQRFNIQRSSLISQLSSQEQQLRSLKIQNEYLKNVLSSYQQQIQIIKSQKQTQIKRLRSQKQKLKKCLMERDIMLKVAKSESAGIEQIMNEEMEKRNQVIEKLIREAKVKSFD